MAIEEYTLFLGDNRRNCSVYSGRFNSIESARELGELTYSISLKPPRLVISSQQFDISDDVTFVPGMAVRTEDGGEPLAIAEVNGANDNEARVSISGQQTSIKQRVKSTGWKFSDLSGAAYKWIVQNKETGWQLHDRRGNAVAGFDGNQFWYCGYANLTIDENVSEELRLLALLSWALSAITTFGSRPGNGSKARVSTTVLGILSNTPHREHQNFLPDFY